MRKNLCKLLLCTLLIFLMPICVSAGPLDDAFNNINYNALFGIAPLDVGDNYFFEVEYNDYLDYADEIDHDYTVCGNLEGEDMDFFKFTLPATSEVTIAAASLDPNFFLVLTDIDGNELDQSMDLGEGEGTYLHAYYNEALAAGTYYIVALNDIYATDVYSFYLEIIPPHSHSYIAVVTNPTCKEMGYTTHTCSCGESYIDTYTPVTTEHTYTDETDTSCNVCGYSELNDTEDIETTPMYRLYNPNSGEHFYTGSTAERDMLVDAGWHYEGVSWNAPIKGGAPVYRVYNPNSGDHHYTMSSAEVAMLVNVGWIYENVCWNSASPSNIPLYRLYNPNADCGSHHYTSSEEERDMLVDVGWILEGIGWYGMLK